MDEMNGLVAQLPNGQKVIIERVEGFVAIVRRIEEPGEGTIAVCDLAKLKLE